jgi:arabinofuranosyltransferase
MVTSSLPRAAPARPAPAAAHPPPWGAHAAALALIAAVTGYLAFGLWGWTYDDAYIIYRYARNVAAGLGLVYNPGEPYLGSSSAG